MFSGRRIVISGVAAAIAAALPLSAPQAQTSLTASVEAEGLAETLATLSPQARILRDVVAATGDEALARFYEENGYKLIWTDARLDALIDAVSRAGDHGLPIARYDVESLRAMLTDLGIEDVTREIAVSDTFLTYARDINSGLLEPRSVDNDLRIKPRRPDQVALLSGLAAADDPTAYLASLAPDHRHYTTLLEEKRRLEELISSGGWGDQVPSGATLRPGDTSPRVVALRDRLGRMDGQDYGDSPVYDETLVQVVKDFQRRHGLNEDGVAGPKTLSAINTSPDTRLEQVVVNLERQRWLNYDRGSRHVYVNQADFSVSIIDDGETTFWSRVVIGKNEHRTQEFNDQMTHMVVNPTWHVPRSIATEEMLPKLKRNPGALGSSMQIMTRSGTRINPALVNFRQFTQQNFPFIIKQAPGTSNALGRVKFMFPNQFNIYLHDTPAKSLFAKDTRAYSHGCVRVQKPFELAYTLLARQTDDPEGLFKRVLASGNERHLNLEEPLPIYLTYQSAWIDDFGVPQYRDDVYGRDGRIFDALLQQGVTLGSVEG